MAGISQDSMKTGTAGSPKTTRVTRSSTKNQEVKGGGEPQVPDGFETTLTEVATQEVEPPPSSTAPAPLEMEGISPLPVQRTRSAAKDKTTQASMVTSSFFSVPPSTAVTMEAAQEKKKVNFFTEQPGGFAAPPSTNDWMGGVSPFGPVQQELQRDERVAQEVERNRERHRREESHHIATPVRQEMDRLSRQGNKDSQRPNKSDRVYDDWLMSYMMWNQRSVEAAAKSGVPPAPQDSQQVVSAVPYAMLVPMTTVTAKYPMPYPVSALPASHSQQEAQHLLQRPQPSPHRQPEV
ncbi:hypothetical protein BDN72DRAFT_906202 [Pluteus cervinus]|uniref:Uncharacterized protein n=1 Tax=Pluteus cervinus TaxID=181527 RepID=A0ACD3A056_9AGAR|nr:hypothetical protein BDN72DRAFT_906202 [Pluteus cervinus]